MKNIIKITILLLIVSISTRSFAQLPGGLNKLKDAGNKVKTETEKIDKAGHSTNSNTENTTGSGNATSIAKNAVKADAEIYFAASDINARLSSFKEGDEVKAVVKTAKAIKNAMPFDGPNTNDVYQMVVYRDGQYLETFPLRFVSNTEYKALNPYDQKSLDSKRIYFDETARSSDKLVFNLMVPADQGSSYESYMLTKFFYSNGKSGKYKIQIQKDNYPEPIIIGASEFEFESQPKNNKLRAMLQTYKNLMTQSDFFVANYSTPLKLTSFKDGDEIKAVFKTEKTINDIFPVSESKPELFKMLVWVDGKNVSTWTVKYTSTDEYAKKDAFAAEGKVLYNNKKDKIPYQYAVDGKRILYYKDAQKSSKELVIDLIASKEHSTTYGAPLVSRSFLQSLSAGIHTIEVQLVADRPNSFNEVCYYAEFTIDCTLGIEKYETVYAPYDKIFQNSIADLTSKTPFPKAVTTNSTIEADFKTLLKNEVGGDVTPTKVSLQFSDWQIEKNKYSGLPLRRKMQACVGYKMKNEPGKCLYHYFWIVQEYEGGGKYGKSLIDGTQNFGDIVEYNCNNL